MTSTIVDVAAHEYKSTDELLLDTNVWLNAYAPRGPRDPRVRIYSRALADMLNAKCRIYVDPLVLAEYANVSAHLKFLVLREEDSSLPKEFTDFRKSEAFADVAADVANEVKAVLKNSRCIDIPFSAVDVAAAVDRFTAGDRDFNDLVIAETCRAKKLILVTDDAGFKDCGLTVLTANRKLLS
jgi:predicted nucleic acid-binding protein